MATTDTRTTPTPTKPTARESLDALVDAGSLLEFGADARHQCTAFGMQAKRPAGDAVVTGTAEIDARPAAVFAQDVSVLGGTLGATHAQKIAQVLDQAERACCPVVGVLDSGGARIQEGVSALDGYASIFRRNVALSGRVPQISVILGACAGGAAYSPALTDLIVMDRRAHMFLTGPKVVRSVTGEEVTAEELGGAGVHSTTSGLAHLVAERPEDAFGLVRKVLSYLPSSCWDAPPLHLARTPELTPEVPAEQRRTYDVRRVVRGLVDADSFLELQQHHATNIVIGFARLDGMPVGVVANQPCSLAGTLDARAAEKGARFVRMCDAFGLPLVTLVDTPGFMPGRAQETEGVIRRGAKLLYAFAEATVPRVTVILRKAYGGAYIVMNSKQIGADRVFAWPTAEIGVMGAEGAVEVVFRRELAADPGRRQELLDNYRAEALSPSLATSRQAVDALVSPAETRDAIIRTFRPLVRACRPRHRHDNMPQ
ncbi:propionyl-CoA carboxylase beta chain [Lentzea fradiae]|uniref:Propionyl-CoA carboxylase beta chain n=1 Tax=Lentzea fradiae TaxID=200378 RepID=A0A1G8CPR9_9PSEU|nr:acyl-CoA carboxylase subunit beta [Lentzea fradiae]SDH46860.1 propionyl-CoA carboxylase beta chain [Lentzea fradiae]